MSPVKKHALTAHSDERGWVVNPLVSPFPEVSLGQVHVASLAPGTVRGNHVHPNATEFVFVWGGRAELVWETENGGVAREELGGDDLLVFEVPPGVAHAVTNTGDGVAYLMAYYFGSSEEEWPETLKRPFV